MFLREIRINGFKSFAEPTRVLLDKGITCIVGPNGCGKSNLVEAVRWVLGEQSTRALRGSKMQEVIFQGTSERKALSFCEVSLIFSDCQEALKTEQSEVEITRRVNSAGEGEYLLNQQRCRLKDIQYLLMDTGVGRASYAFMMQGQIDQILASNPEQRRGIFEEAAGITKYKSQRREAFNKLELTERNLTRVTDIIEELSRQLSSLERQARKALRYKRAEQQVKYLNLAHEAHRYHGYLSEKQNLQEQFDRLGTRVHTNEGELRASEAELKKLHERRQADHNRIQETQQKLFEMRNQEQNRQNQAELAKTRQAELSERLALLKKESEQLQGKLKELQKDPEVQAEQAKAQKALELSTSQLQHRQKELEELQREARELQDKMDASQESILEKDSQLNRLRQQCASLQLEQSRYQIQHASISDTAHELKQRSMQAEQDLKEKQKLLNDCETLSQKSQKELEALQAKHAELSVEFEALQENFHKTEHELTTAKTRLSTLQELQQRLEGFSEGTRALLKKSPELQPLSRLLEVQAPYAAALDLLLGAAEEAIHCTDAAEARQLLEALGKSKVGSAVFQLPLHSKMPSANAASKPDWLIAATEVIQARSPKFQNALTRLLAGCYFAPKLESFVTYWQQNPEFPFFMVATHDGGLIDARGLIFDRRCLKDSEKGFLARKAEAGKLEKTIAELEISSEAQADKRQAIKASLCSLEPDSQQKQNACQELELQSLGLKNEIQSLEASIQELRKNAKQHREQLGNFEKDRSEADEQLEAAQADITACETAIHADKGSLESFRVASREIRQKCERCQENCSGLQIQIATKKQHLELLDQGIGQRGSALELTRSRLAQCMAEAESSEQKLKELEVQFQENQPDGDLASGIKALETQLDNFRTAALHYEKDTAKAEAQVQQMRSEQQGHDEQFRDCQMRLAQLSAKAELIEERVRTDQSIELKEIDWRHQLFLAKSISTEKVDLEELLKNTNFEQLEAWIAPKDTAPKPAELKVLENTDWDAVAKELGALKDRLQSMGVVNLVAIEEYGQLKQRHGVLKQQSQDLWSSKDQLLAAIDEVNKISEEKFSKTFQQIRENFKTTFKKLFGGGKADLSLIESEDILDSGIDIVAQPPGTRLKSLALLSGGQRVMTAVSLLFAIYMTKPSPFVVLDELDAPLDDANVGRFVEMVQEFVQYSQFLIVTHNKRTVAAAKTIHGVTMQERGVTQMVSMSFESAQKNIARAQAQK